jgi:hypothetical protein
MAGVFSAFLQEQGVFWQCARSYLLLPIMFVMLAIAWIFCTVFLIIGILLADFCYGSPDQNVSEEELVNSGVLLPFFHGQ